VTRLPLFDLSNNSKRGHIILLWKPEKRGNGFLCGLRKGSHAILVWGPTGKREEKRISVFRYREEKKKVRRDGRKEQKKKGPGSFPSAEYGGKRRT